MVVKAIFSLFFILLCVYGAVIESSCAVKLTSDYYYVDHLLCGTDPTLERLICDTEKGNKCLGTELYVGCFPGQCASGHYCNVNGVCKKCGDYCKTCLNSFECTECIGDYFLNTTIGACTKKLDISNCKIPDNETDGTGCKECLKGYYFDKVSLCLRCPSNCTECSPDGKCLLGTCGIGKYWDDSAKKCLDGVPNCLVEDGAAGCQFCNFGYFLYTDSNKKLSCVQNSPNCAMSYSFNTCSECEAGYLLDDNVQCTKIPFDNCLESADGKTCTKCEEGFFSDYECSDQVFSKCIKLNKNGECTQCEKGYYVDEYQEPANVCQPCYSTTECAECSGPNPQDCSSCSAGFATAYDFGCKECMSACKICTDEYTCTECIEGFFLDKYEDSTECIECTPYCKVCESVDLCKTCADGYDNIDGLCFQCSDTGTCSTCGEDGCTEAAPGSYLDGGIAKKCPAKCATCTDESTCDTCATNYFNDGSDCKSCGDGCADCQATGCQSVSVGYWLYDSVSYMCGENGEAGCLAENCDSVNGCSLANDGYFLYDYIAYSCDGKLPAGTCTNCDATSGCLESAPGTYVNAGVATKCPNFCTLCEPSGEEAACTECETNYYLYEGLCYECIAKGQGVGCAPENCQTDYGCVQAEPGYYLDEYAVANKCPTGCKTCDSADVCTECETNYAFDENQGSLCYQAAGCKEALDSKFCKTCADGYYMYSEEGVTWNRVCSKCLVDNCLYCYYPNELSCDYCLNGYMMSPDWESCGAKKCDEHCMECRNSYSCRLCNSGYYNSDGVCKPCYDVNACIACNGPTKLHCLTCAEGYVNTNGAGCYPCSNNPYGTVKTCGPKPVNSTGFIIELAHTKTLECKPYAKKTFKCKGYVENCLVASSDNSCKICKTGYTPDPYIGICKRCDINACAECSELGKCQTCITGYYPETTFDSTVCTPCKLNQCKKCTKYTCLECNENYKLWRGECYPCNENNTISECNCLSGKYWNAPAKTCSSCTENCVTCYNTSYCTECAKGTYLDFDTKTCFKVTQPNCVAVHPTGKCKICYSNSTYDNTINGCIECSKKYDGCQTCTSTECKSCKSGFFFDKNITACVKCNTKIPYCATCATEGICDLCEDGYYWDAGRNSCTKCMKGCKLCGSSTSCESCENNYRYLNISFCSPCPSGCEICSGTKFCDKCNEGYYADSLVNSCDKCHGLCSKCFGPTMNNCTICIENATLSSNTCSCNSGLVYDDEAKKCTDKTIMSKGIFVGNSNFLLLTFVIGLITIIAIF